MATVLFGKVVRETQRSGFKLLKKRKRSRCAHSFISAPPQFPLPSLFLFVCAHTVHLFTGHLCLSPPTGPERGGGLSCVFTLSSAHTVAPHIRRLIGEQGELWEALQCVCVCVRSDEIKPEVTQRGTGSGGTEGGDSFHLHTIAEALMRGAHTNTLQKTLPILRLNSRRSLAKFASADQQREEEEGGGGGGEKREK